MVLMVSVLSFMALCWIVSNMEVPLLLLLLLLNLRVTHSGLWFWFWFWSFFCSFSDCAGMKQGRETGKTCSRVAGQE